MTALTKPKLVFHADWSNDAPKRWCAKAILGGDGRYTSSGPLRVGDLTMLFKNLRAEAGALGTVFAGFDFPIGVPAHYAKRAGISKFQGVPPAVRTGRLEGFLLGLRHSGGDIHSSPVLSKSEP